MTEGITAPETENTPKYSTKGLRNLIDRTGARIASGDSKNDQSVRESILRSSNQIQEEEIVRQTQRAEEAERNSMFDPKTGLHNDKWINERLDTAIREAQRTGKRFFVAFMDIDDFKIVNSRFDHSEGDKFLRLFTYIQTRPNEEVARFGGDEFVQILSDDIQEYEAIAATSRNAQNFVEKSRDLISQIPIIDSQTPELEEVTLSVGLVQYRPGMTIKAIKAESSQMLLKSKSLGRDRISLRNSEGEVKVFDRLGNQIPDPVSDPVKVL